MAEFAVIEGGCRCGGVRFRVSGPPLLTSACHCRGCQRMTGSAYALSVTVAPEAFEVTAGEPVLGGLRATVPHYHCPKCMSWVFTRPDDVPIVNVRTPMLDDPAPFPPFADVWLAEKLPWVEPTSANRFDQVPTMDGWPALVAAYQTRADQ